MHIHCEQTAILLVVVVWHAPLSLFTMYAHCIGTLYMCTVYVHHICVLYMYTVYVHCLCVLYMCTVYVYCICTLCILENIQLWEFELEQWITRPKVF